MRTFGIVLLFSLFFLSACLFSYDYNGTQFLCKDQECPTGFKCLSGRCISNKTVSCGSDANCPSGQHCSNTICVTGTPPDAGPLDKQPACVSNIDCGVNRYCIKGKCSAGGQDEPCENTLQCKTGYVCQALGKQKVCLKQCKGDHNQCNGGYLCRRARKDSDAVCVPSCGVIDTRNCLPTERCLVQVEGRGTCEPQNGGKPVGLTCQKASDCQVNLLCKAVKGFPSVLRCANYCEMGNPRSCPNNQTCLPIQGNRTIGYCQPLPPPPAQKGELCGGDILCANGLSCTNSRCK